MKEARPDPTSPLMKENASVNLPLAPFLIYIDPKDRKYKETRHKFTVQTTNIGRKKDNEISLISKFISRYHARIDVEENHNGKNGDTVLVFKDLDSSSGSRINGERVHTKVLEKGDQIKLGRTLLVYYGKGGFDALIYLYTIHLLYIILLFRYRIRIWI